MSECDDIVGALTSPEGESFADYINGENGENNPYSEGSEYHRDYSAEMNRLLGESK